MENFNIKKYLAKGILNENREINNQFTPFSIEDLDENSKKNLNFIIKQQLNGFNQQLINVDNKFSYQTKFLTEDNKIIIEVYSKTRKP